MLHVRLTTLHLLTESPDINLWREKQYYEILQKTPIQYVYSQRIRISDGCYYSIRDREESV